MNRSSSIARLRDSSAAFDLLVVGGGATGLGTALDAAARGYRVALVERGDFACGTSSRSTKLVHGGVRYLRQGNVALVREALRERGRLARNAPHLVRDLAFVVPCYSRWDSLQYRVGMGVYDRLAGRLRFGPSLALSREETREMVPTVETAGLRGGVVYHDGQFDDARLAINLAQTAEEQGAVLVNYCECVALAKQGGRVGGAILRDLEAGSEFEIRARVVINATGVFTDRLRAVDVPKERPMLTVSQGVHLVLPRAFLPGDAALMIPKTADGRVLFAIPWHGHVVIGTTDTPVATASREPRALVAERDFLMEHARRYLAKDPIDSDVTSVFAGLRPLITRGIGGATAALSREHTIVVSESGLVTIAGGKWTTYRKMAADVVDRAAQVAGLPHRPATTEQLSLHGSPAWLNHDAPNVYGEDADEIESIIDQEPALGQRLHEKLPYRAAEVIWHAREEMARTVEDVLARRTRALLLNARVASESAPLVARLLARELGRDADWASDQVRGFRELARGYMFSEATSTARAAPAGDSARLS